MTIRFERPVGAPADLKELEYISALHQTCMPELRQDASIDATDIRNLLSSRHGLLVDEKEIKRLILMDLAGESDESLPLHKLDLCQVVAILIIPELLYQSQNNSTNNNSNSSSNNLLQVVLYAMTTKESPKLTLEFLRSLLEFHGETQITRQTLQLMLDAAGGEGTVLNASTLLHALTSDVTHYNIQWKEHLTTHYEDAFLTVFDSSDERQWNDAEEESKDEKNGATRTTNNPADRLVTIQQPNKTDSIHRMSSTRGDEENGQKQGTTISTSAHGHDAEIGLPVQDKTEPSTTTSNMNVVDQDNLQQVLENKESSTTGKTVHKPIKSFVKYRSKAEVQVDGIKHLWTAPFIDSVADTDQSQAFTVTLWVSMIVVYLAYFWNFDLSWGAVSCDSLSEFWCKMINGITSWLVIFVELCVLGSAYIFFGGAGNAVYQNRWIGVSHLFVGMTTIVFATILSLVYVVDTEVVNTRKEPNLAAAYYSAALLGGILLLLQLVFLIRLFYPLDFLKGRVPFEMIHSPSIKTMERRTKRAAQRKVSLLIENALKYHGSPTSLESTSLSKSFEMTAYGTSLLNFQTQAEETVVSGGILWGWKRVLDGTIFDEEGLWLHSRLVAGNITQLFLGIFLVVFIVYWILGVAGVSGGENPLEGTTIYPYEIAIAGSFGILAGVLACFAIAIVNIPSFVSSVLKLRSGVIPTLRSKDFLMYRFAEDEVTYLFGSTFWGCFFTGTGTAVVVGGVVFVVVWNQSRPIMVTLLAQLLGIGVTQGLKIVILCFLRRKFRSGFYRKQPLCDNFLNVALQCWNIGLTSGFVLIRSARLLLVTLCYLGRLDTELLAPGVGFIGSIPLDSGPVAYRKDILQHEAHRHPYIERLATMYMLKLRYGNDFGRRGNSCWRLLFVICLLPWMRKYRLRTILGLEGLDLEIEVAEAELSRQDSSDDREMATPERRLVRESTKRKLESMKKLRSMRDLKGVTSREELLEREVIILQDRNRQLMDQVRELGGAPFRRRSSLMSEFRTQTGEGRLSLLAVQESSQEDLTKFFDSREE